MTGFSTVVLFLLLLVGCVVALIAIGKKHNNTNWGNGVLNVLDGINVWLCRIYHRMPPRLIDLPASGAVILVANHTSGLDPMLLLAATNRPLRFMIAHEEYDRWWLKWLLKMTGCIPVKRDKNPKKALSESLTALNEGEVLAVFPQGGIVVKDTGKSLKQGAFVLAKMADAPVICVRIEGVKAKGFAMLAVFVRSNIQIIQDTRIHQITEENSNLVMNDLKQFFFAQSV